MNEKEIVAATTVGFSHHHTVRFQEIDAAGIVYFATVISYMHDAYAAFLAARGVGLGAVLEEGTLAMPLRHAEADFLRPIRLGESLEVQIVGRSELGTKVAFYYRIIGGTEVKAVGQTVHVFLDRKTFLRAEPSPALRTAIESLPVSG